MEEIKIEETKFQDNDTDLAQEIAEYKESLSVKSKDGKFISIKDQSPSPAKNEAEGKPEIKNMNMYLNKLNQNERIVYSRLKKKLNKYKTDNKYPKKGIRFLD